ncbi:ribbon-helix-helix protein, CopG family [Saccharolobus islandicus]|uniref:CopG domain protein DNA-binding domain protein n=1 Tax=Saccharolobus islandicus (strain M.16.27) TaxID=427318 RepID=C3N5W4_SACI3|nr:ribbon-helix-helix protein, CopG family [Sulfolobus islandicus]ACP55389.1 CopG domain protein DNA-binding domain protein [Sulfolobus islandicus M.16.27]
MRVITFKADEELLKQLDLYCINNKKERSEVIREAIEHYLLCERLRGRVYRRNTIIEENLQNKTAVREL